MIAKVGMRVTQTISPDTEKHGDKQHVYVTVQGGVAHVAYASANVEVHIFDFDDLEADYEGTSAGYSAEEKEVLRRIEAEEVLR